MSFYGIETGLTSFLTRVDPRAESRSEMAKRVAAKLAELRASGLAAIDDDAELDGAPEPPLA